MFLPKMQLLPPDAVVAISTAIDSAGFAGVVSTAGSAKENPAKLNSAIKTKIFKICFIVPPYFLECFIAGFTGTNSDNLL